MQFALVLCCSTALLICGCGSHPDSAFHRTSEKAELRTKLLHKAAQAELLSSMLFGDKLFRDNPISYADITDAEIEQTIASLDKLLAMLEESAHHSYLSAEDRRSALEELAKRSFDVDPIIKAKDLDAIIEIIQKYECIDPRIMRIAFVDENTLELSCGFVKGPLYGGGTNYVAHRKNGVWRITYKSSWVS